MKSYRSAVIPALVLVVSLSLFPSVLRADSELEKTMKNMEDIKKELYPAMKAPVPADKGKYIELAKALKADGEIAKTKIPQMAKRLPEADRDAMVAAYSKDMDEFIKTTDSLVQALEKDQWDQAQALITTLKAEEKAGHKAYRPKKENGGGH